MRNAAIKRQSRDLRGYRVMRISNPLGIEARPAGAYILHITLPGFIERSATECVAGSHKRCRRFKMETALESIYFCRVLKELANMSEPTAGTALKY